MHILLVEDEISIASVVEKFVVKEGYSCAVLHEGTNVMSEIEKNQPNLVILDVMLPGIDGISLCKLIREAFDIPIIMLTAKSSEMDRIEGLSAGADDYLCKPFSATELVLRVNAVVRRVYGENSHPSSGLSVNIQDQKASFENASVELTTLECAMLKLLFSRPNRVFSRDNIMNEIYQDFRVVSDRTIDSHVSKLRKKLTSISPAHELVQSVYGAGYKYVPPEQ